MTSDLNNVDNESSTKLNHHLIHQQRVIFGDTDQMGVVYYGNYMRYFEASRAAFLRATGRNQKDLDAWGVALPVVEAHCRYRRPAHYEDLLDVHVVVGQVRGASMRFEYEVWRDGELIAEGYTRHACVDTAGRPKPIPPQLMALLTARPTSSARAEAG